jgi:SAM-dependent methyltransferase
MLFLSSTERAQWAEMGAAVSADVHGPEHFVPEVRSVLRPAFHYFAGTRLLAAGHHREGLAWLVDGSLREAEGQFSNGFLVGFLHRHNGELKAPAVVFADPAPFVHWASVPKLRDARARFVQQTGRTLPPFRHPFRVVDIGCGDGGLTVRLVRHLREVGSVGDIAEIVLVDASAGMCELAARTVGEAFPDVRVTTVRSRIEACSTELEGHFDLAVASLAYHHMPFETKLVHLERLRGRLDHFLLFEVEANNDSPGLHSPELALSIYQSYGSLIDWVFAHDAPVGVALASVDDFLMTEAVSFLTQPRGARSDYHMLRGQWHDVFTRGLGRDFTCWSDTNTYADEAMNLITMHYGR